MLTHRRTPFVVFDGDEPPAGGPPPAPPAPPEPQPAPPAPPARDDAAFARLRREAQEAEARAKAAEEALAERQRQEAEEQGRFKELAEQEKARADAAEARWAEAEQARQIESVARTLRFKDPDLVVHLLPGSVDRNDTDAVRAALEAVATERPHLIDSSTPPPPPPSGGPAGGGTPPPPGLTAEQLRGMTPQQIAALDPKVVNDALANA